MGLLVTGNKELADQFRYTRLLHGATPGVMEAYTVSWR
jgi:hypothetical protein